MSRARTNVGEWWEVEYSPGLRNSNMFRRNSGRKKAHEIAREVGGKVFHVTRYRLAPLVKLVWRVDPECPNELDAWHAQRGAIATVSRGGYWTIWGLLHEAGYGDTFAKAKAACAARLLELGYRVVDEKGGAR